MTRIQNDPSFETTAAKRTWTKPEIATFEAAIVTKGALSKVGDGISNS